MIIIKTLGVEHFLAFVGSVRTDISILTKILFCDTPPLRHGRAPDIWQKVEDGSPHSDRQRVSREIPTMILLGNVDLFLPQFQLKTQVLKILQMPVNHRQPKY